MRAWGYRIRYAPSTPDTAPLAPIMGIGEPGPTTVWARAAATPERK